MANSFKQMAKDGTIKRPDGRMTMNLDDTLREEGDVLLLTPGTREEINKILNEYRQQHPQTFDAEQQEAK
ncbi:hypothetical protein I1A46_01720 [Serratia liquefaciens]|uniref:hypothetical protein n=1 Tax=Serratia liquefaciens TaxID=614 RepID=UPI0018A7CB0E|nr:hypothetical protein [Serratia liquefaciens]MBF8103843.1 hypothetical protein [Serratia liquefaciens]